MIFRIATSASTEEHEAEVTEAEGKKVSLEKEYRPKRFEDVWGQDYPRKFLSGLIRRGQKGRHLLLHGAHASGKTSLAHIYARALNCAAPTATGSPCGKCKYCSEPNPKLAGFFEHDVSGTGGDKKTIRGVVDGLLDPPRDYKYRVFFFDEAHSLERDAADSLLKIVEDARPGIVFCFATTEFARIPAPLRSRLSPLEIRSLSASDAVLFLRDIADKERIRYEPEALTLLAGVKEGYPRDLLIALDQLREDGESKPITKEMVREALDVDQTETLVAYFEALADGDPERQLALMTEWREPPEDKIKWVSAFLLALYYNNILGRSLFVDALVYSIQEERSEILDRFQKRLGVGSRKDLAPHWRKMLDFWGSVDPALDEVRATLTFDLFHDLVNARIGEAVPPARTEAVESSHARPSEEEGATNVIAHLGDEQSQFFGFEHARAIINSASFLIQEHGVLFNAAFLLHTPLLGARTEAEGRALVEAFCAELGEQAGMWRERGAERFAALTLLENDGGIVGRVVAHLPVDDEGVDEADAAVRHKVAEWTRHWRNENHINAEALDFTLLVPGKKALAFHWDQAFSLCAGLSEEALAYDPAQGSERPLIDILRIPKSKQRSSSPASGGLLFAFGLLQPDAVERACQNRMEPLSAFDDKQWDILRGGWELQEHRERLAEKEDRRRRLEVIEARYGRGTETACEHADQLVRSWPSDPRLRQRKWQGWFHEG